ncbi:hypothetical protein VP01_441g6 [Puccinia sorghi]|uniref:Glycoside hydrolase family 5 domain-containing protein n=1 Tax=Puccinia sorghi TaxID=27349 RepID=A0A0L6UPJ2_9BASI|nr:hypothetical protein VP01_441g6 [Puccinia sorghi]
MIHALLKASLVGLALLASESIGCLPATYKYGTNLGGRMAAGDFFSELCKSDIFEPWMNPVEWLAMGGEYCPTDSSSCAASEWRLSRKLGQKAANEAFLKHWQSWFTQDHVNQLKALKLDHVRIPLGFVGSLPGSTIQHKPDQYFYWAGGWMELKRGLRQLRDAGFHVTLDMHALPGVSASNQQFAGNVTSDVQFYQDHNYRRALTWSAVLTAMSHLDPDFSSVVAIECINEPLMDVRFPCGPIFDAFLICDVSDRDLHPQANLTPGLETYYSDFVTITRAIEYTLGVQCETDLLESIHRLAHSKNALAALGVATSLIPIYARKANVAVDPKVLGVLKNSASSSSPVTTAPTPVRSSIHTVAPRSNILAATSKTCLATMAMPKRWQWKGDAASMANHTLGPAAYDDHTNNSINQEKKTCDNCGVADANLPSYLRTMCNQKNYENAIKLGETVYGLGEFSLAVNFNTTHDDLRAWGDAQRFRYNQVGFAIKSEPARWKYRADLIDGAETHSKPAELMLDVNGRSYLGAVAAGVWPRDPSHLYNPHICAPYVNSTTGNPTKTSEPPTGNSTSSQLPAGNSTHAQLPAGSSTDAQLPADNLTTTHLPQNRFDQRSALRYTPQRDSRSLDIPINIQSRATLTHLVHTPFAFHCSTHRNLFAFIFTDHSCIYFGLSCFYSVCSCKLLYLFGLIMRWHRARKGRHEKEERREITPGRGDLSLSPKKIQIQQSYRLRVHIMKWKQRSCQALSELMLHFRTTPRVGFSLHTIKYLSIPAFASHLAPHLQVGPNPARDPRINPIFFDVSKSPRMLTFNNRSLSILSSTVFFIFQVNSKHPVTYKYGTNIGGWLLVRRIARLESEPWMKPVEWTAMGGEICDDSSACAASEWSLTRKLGQARANEAFMKHWKSWFTQNHVNQLKELKLDHVRIPLGFVGSRRNQTSKSFMMLMSNLSENLAVDRRGTCRRAGRTLCPGWLDGAEKRTATTQQRRLPRNTRHACPAGDVQFYQDHNYRRALTWSAVLTAMSHLDPDFSSVVAIECINEPLNDVGFFMASLTPGLEQYYSDFVTITRVIEYAIGVECEADLQRSIQRLSQSKNGQAALRAAIPLIVSYANKAKVNVDSKILAVLQKSSVSSLSSLTSPPSPVPSSKSRTPRSKIYFATTSRKTIVKRQSAQNGKSIATKPRPSCLATVAMPKRWQYKGDGNSMSNHTLGPAAYDDHMLTRKPLRFFDANQKMYFAYGQLSSCFQLFAALFSALKNRAATNAIWLHLLAGGVADSNIKSYLSTICKQPHYHDAQKLGETPYGHGEFSLANNFNATHEQLRQWGKLLDVSCLKETTTSDEIVDAIVNLLQTVSRFWNFRVGKVQEPKLSQKMIETWSVIFYFLIRSLEAGIWPKDPAGYFNPSICEPYLTSTGSKTDEE